MAIPLESILIPLAISLGSVIGFLGSTYTAGFLRGYWRGYQHGKADERAFAELEEFQP